jgi:hypothetical protein
VITRLSGLQGDDKFESSGLNSRRQPQIEHPLYFHNLSVCEFHAIAGASFA